MRWISCLLVAVLTALVPVPQPTWADDELPQDEPPEGPGDPPAAPPTGAPTPHPTTLPPTAVPVDPNPSTPSWDDEPETPAAPAPKSAASAPTPAVHTPDRVRLKNGSEWVGRIVHEDETSIIVQSVSRTGGVSRIKLPRKDIVSITRGEQLHGQPAGNVVDRSEWFLLHSDGRAVGTRHIQVVRIQTEKLDGWRVSEEIFEFAQGRHLPATRIRTVEVTDKDFFPVLIDFREATEGNVNADDRFSRRVSGNVGRGTWTRARNIDGHGTRRDVLVPEGTRGRLGHREFLLRQPRRVGVASAKVLDASHEGVVEVRAGFVSVEPDEHTANTQGDEFHWEHDGVRLISRFARTFRGLREQIAEGLVALPASQAQCTAAASTGEKAKDPKDTNPFISLVPVGIKFRKPGPTWQWKPRLEQRTDTGWRPLGRLHTPIYLADARMEWHPESYRDARDDADVEQWLLHRLRALDAGLRVVSARGTLLAPKDTWRMDVEATLRGETIRTAVVVLNRRPGRAVILFACPIAAWAEGQAALQLFLKSIQPL